MTQRGTSPRNPRSGQSGLAWNSPNLAGEQTLSLSSPDFAHEGTIPAVHASARAGGKDLSPALTWSPAPQDTAQLLLVIEDPDAPTPTPYVHCVALLDPSVTGLAHGALDASNPPAGVRLLRSGRGRGYLGPEPPKAMARTGTSSSSSPWPRSRATLPCTPPSHARCWPPPATSSPAAVSTASTGAPEVMT